MDFRNEFEIEVKFLFNLYENLRFYGIIKDTLEQFKNRSKTKCRFYTNHYYDTLSLKLYDNQISLRQTRDTNDMFVTNTFKVNVS
jgi:inorganic triphosphatase YgiF